MNHCDLSRLVCGWVAPSAAQRKKFEKALGKKKVEEIFGKGEEG